MASPQAESIHHEEVEDKPQNPEDDDAMHAQEPSKREKRRKEMLDRLTSMENDFYRSKEEIYVEKMAALSKELEEISQGTHPEWLEMEQRLKEEYERELERIALQRDYLLESAARLYELEKTQSIEDYANDRLGLRERMLQDLEQRRKKLREERENFDVMTSMESSFEMGKPRIPRRMPGRVVPGGPGSAYYEDGTTTGLGPSRRGGYGSRSGRGRQAGVAVPIVPVLLRDQEILEDLSTLRKAALPPGQSFSGSSTRLGPSAWGSTGRKRI